MDSANVLVARFLRHNNYTQTLEAFLREAALPESVAEVIAQDDITIEKILLEKAEFDQAVQFERLSVDDGPDTGWTQSDFTPEEVLLSTKSNILAVSANAFASRPDQVLISTASKELLLVDGVRKELLRTIPSSDGSPILSFIVLADRYILTGSMAGQLALIDSRDGSRLASRKDHDKFLVQIASHYDATTSSYWVVTAAWDAKLCLYKVSCDEGRISTIEAPVAILKLESNPEALLFTTRPKSNEPLLILTRRDFALLYYYTITPTLRLIGTQDLAPMSNSWVAFTPSALAICPSDPELIAVATSSTPHMKLLLVRLLIPPPQNGTSAVTDGQLQRAKQDRELAAIQIQCTTMAPQTQYSTPAVVWRPDGSGVWVNGDDGVVRGIERKTGKVVASLSGHEPGKKVRCLYAARIGGNKDEVLVTGGFDGRLIVWATRQS